MAIRSTNAGRHMPTGGGQQPDSYAQHDPNAPTYGNIPGGRQLYYGDPNERSVHTPGSSRGQQGAFRPPSQPDFYVDHATPFYDAQHGADVQRRADLLGGNDAYQQAKSAGDMRGQIAAMMALKQQMQQQRFVDQGGTPETWQNRFDPNNNWPVPRSPSGNYQYAPGRPGPTPPGVAGGAPSGGRTMPPAASTQALTPDQNPMMQGYLGGGAGVPQGAGGFGPMGGGYNPGQSKSGVGQSPMSMMSTGGDTGMYGGGASGGIPPQFLQMLLASRMGGSMGGLAPFNGGGYNPFAAMGGMY